MSERSLPDAEIATAGMARVAARFPGAEGALHALVRIAPAFLDLCEEYELASNSLARLLVRAESADRPEIQEYRSIIAELETEIARMLRTGTEPV